MIILIFVPRKCPSVLAHGHFHCVLGITLPPSDATLFIALVGLPSAAKKRFDIYTILALRLPRDLFETGKRRTSKQHVK